MSMYFRPIVKADKNTMTHGNSASITKAQYNTYSGNVSKGVMSDEIFGKTEEHKLYRDIVYEDEYTRVAYIDFPEGISIINPFLAGRTYAAWAALTGLKSQEVVDIIKYKLIWDNTAESLIDRELVRNDNWDNDMYTCGPDILIKMIDNIDYNEKIERHLKDFYIAALHKATGVKDLEKHIIELNSSNAQEVATNLDSAEYIEDIEVPGYVYLTNKYVLDLRDRDDLLNEDGTISEAYLQMVKISNDWQMEEAASSPDQFNLLQLYQMAAKDKGKFIKAQLMTYIFVIPVGYRPSSGFRQYGLTKAYEDVIKEVNKLTDTMRRNDNSVLIYTNALARLQAAVEKVMVGVPANKKSKRDANYKSIAEELKGKSGFIRDRLEGARTDFSGRTVITLDPDLAIDEIGVPIDILAKVAEPQLVKAFTQEARNNENLHLKRNMTSFHLASDSSQYGISYIEFLKKYFNENDIYGIIGRQPTLFYLGMEAFKVRPIEGNAIALSPLMVMPFNADFDGDQMHFSLPQTPGGIEDVRKKMAFRNNLWYPKNGSLTVVVRHEIQYGLWECLTRESNGTASGCTSRAQVYEGICSGDIPLEAEYKGHSAGLEAFFYCIFGNNISDSDVWNEWSNRLRTILGPGGADESVKILKPSELSDVLYNIAGNVDRFLGIINKIVHLGFAVSRFYPPAISVVTKQEVNDYVEKKIDEFNTKMTELRHLVDIGLELESNYDIVFSREYENFSKGVKSYLINNMDKNNGYWRMVVSGSKGDSGNLMQIFGIKGRVQKSDMEAFNTTIDGSYARQLTGLEHFVTAYGSRKGIADKVLSTAKPGYMSRKLEHAGAPLYITNTLDCSNGALGDDVPAIDFLPEDVIPFIDPNHLSPFGIRPTPEDYKYNEDGDLVADDFYNTEEYKRQLEIAVNTLAEVLVGRFCITETANVFIPDKTVAENFIQSQWGNGGGKPVRMRSPITCNDPCCALCYGRDLTKGMYVKEVGNGPKDYTTTATVLDGDTATCTYTIPYGPELKKRKYRQMKFTIPSIGKNIGFIAAQAIGEPGTQMVMKNFQKGGIAGDANLTSSFDLIEANFDLKKFSNDVLTNGVVLYDPVAPVSGYVKKINTGNNISKVIITNTEDPYDKDPICDMRVMVRNNTRLKKYVRAGDSMLFALGNVDVREKIKYGSIDAGWKYLMLNLYTIFHSAEVASIHFECIIRNMICYKLLADAGDYKAGDIVTFHELGIPNLCVIPILVGVKYLPKFKPEFLQSIAVESQTTYVPRAILVANKDNLTDPIMRTAFGLKL